MNTRYYLIKIHTNLQDRNTYKPLTCNRTNAIVNDICTLIEYIHSLHITGKVTNEFLLPPKNTRTSLFYGIPKIHKPGWPLRPIVSGCYGPTNHLSACITHFIQPLASNLPLHIKDTKNILNLTEKLPPLPPNALLVTADVTSLCTNIPHEEGIATLIHFMEKYKYLLPKNCPLAHIVHIILDFILKHSTFKFMDTHIHKILDTFMGTRLALCNSVHGQKGTHHNPNFSPPNLLLETFHWWHFLHFFGLPLPTQILNHIHEYIQPHY